MNGHAATTLNSLSSVAQKLWRPAIILLTLCALLFPKTRLAPGSYALLFALPLAWVAVRERESGDFKLWTIYALSFVAFALTRPMLDNLGQPVRVHYPMIVDRIIGFGTLPTVRLQALHLPFLDWLGVVVHMTYYFAPPLAGFYIWRRKECFSRFVFSLVSVYAVALVIHALVPTAPPWLAAEQGHAAGIQRQLFSLLFPELYTYGMAVSGANDVAAMPSVHMAVATVVGLGMGRYGWIYAVLMGYSLVHIGEHYVTDVLAGALLAILAWAFFAGKISPGRKTWET